jgi:methyltransferase (TIGR00027 family)
VKDEHSSVTARFVAFARTAASSHPMTTPALHDELASRLLPIALRPLTPHGPLGQTLARLVTFGLVDHIALRTAAIDAALDPGFAQVVILGAGLDARAYRLASLEGARVFEVDHPASQAAKLEGVRGLTPRCASLSHVAVDFVKQDLDAVLAERGHDKTLATAWLLEGVTMYLPEAITRGLLTVIGRRSATGSRLAMTYIRPPENPFSALLRRAVDLPLERMGEPFRATYTTEEIAVRLREVGLSPRSDTCSREWSDRFGASALLARGFRPERLVIAEV